MSKHFIRLIFVSSLAQVKFRIHYNKSDMDGRYLFGSVLVVHLFSHGMQAEQVVNSISIPANKPSRKGCRPSGLVTVGQPKDQSFKLH